MEDTQEVTPTAAGGTGIIAAAVDLIRHHAGDRNPVPRLSAAARTRLVARSWGPDLTDLEDCVQRALVLCDGDLIEPHHLSLGAVGARDGERRETAAILKSLRASRGRRRDAAQRLGITPRTLRRKVAVLRERGVAVPGTDRPDKAVHHE